MVKLPKVIVLILNYNGKKLLKDCISSYLLNGYKNFEIILIDNGSDDGSLEFIHNNFPQIKVLESKENLGYSAGFNYGIEYVVENCEFDYLLISNNDIFADHNSIEELVVAAEQSNNVGFVTGKVYHYYNNRTNILQTVGKEKPKKGIIGKHIGFNEKDVGQYENIEERYLIDDVFMLVTKKVIVEIGGYDELFFIQCEEADWQLRAKHKGFRIIYTPKAMIWHKGSYTSGGWINPKIWYYQRRNLLILMKKYADEDDYQKFMIDYCMKETPKLLIKEMIHGKIDLMVANVKGFLSGFFWIIKN